MCLVCVTQLYCILDYRNYIQKNQSEVVSGFARNYYAQHGTCDVGSYRYCESDVNYNKTDLLNEVVGVVFKSGRKYSKECKATRIDVDKNMTRILAEW